MGKTFQFCASCINFRAERDQDGMKYYCSRLGYETNPKYQFNCWTPKEQVRKLMDKSREEEGNNQ